MYESASLNSDPRNEYNVSVIFDRIHVIYKKTGKVIYNGEIPKIIEGRKGSRVSKNLNEIFYDREILDFFIHEIRPNETYRIIALGIRDGAGDISKCSGEMESSEHVSPHKLNIKKIAGLDILTYPVRGQIALRYMGEFTEKDSLQENKGPNVPRNIKKWAVKEAIRMMKIQIGNKESNSRGGMKSYI